MPEKVLQKKGVLKLTHEVFHFPKYEDPVLGDGQILTDFCRPHVSVDHGDMGPSATRQEFKQECDVNEIMARYEETGVLPNVVGEPFYYDFTSLPETMLDAMNVMRIGVDAFMTLPAKVRREFDNDAAAFVDYASDPANLDQMREWGLAPPAKAPEPPPVAAPAPESAPGAAAPPVAPGAAPKPA